MIWEIGFSKQAKKFLDQRHVPSDSVIDLTQLAIRKLRGETVAVDLKRLSGVWENCFRIRKGKMRIIFSLQTDKRKVLIEVIDYRGSAYR